MRRLSVFFALAFLVAVGTSGTSAPPGSGRSQKHTTEDRQQSNRPQNYARRTALLQSTPIEQTSQPKTSSQQDASQKQWWQRLLGFIAQIRVEWVIAVATSIYAFFAYRQWLAIHRQANISEIAARAAEEGADAAKRYAGIAASSMERQLRAYVHIQEAVMKFDPKETPQAFVKIKNSGQTPAHNVRSAITMAIGKYPPDFVFPSPTPSWQSQTVLGSGVTGTLSVKRREALTAEKLPLLGTVEQTIYVFGEIRYKDVFGHEWVTKYRMLYGGPTGVRGMALNYDTEGNEAT